MRERKSYKVVKPVNLDGYGTVAPGKPETVRLHPRRALFLVTAGILEPVDAAAEKPLGKEVKP